MWVTQNLHDFPDAVTIPAMRIFLSLLLISAAWAQQPQPEPAKPKRMPEPKNLKILKVAPNELIPLMRQYSASLGVQCVHCHVKGDFASDENHHKEIARTMIAMTQDINAKLGGGEKAHVSCYTCHRGEMHPEVDAPAPPAPPNAPPPPPPAK
jgi:hypothetical protein